MTRKARKEYAKKAYKHVIEEFLEQKIGGNIDKALANSGYNNDITCVVKLRESDLDKLVHEESVGTDVELVPLNRGSRNLLRCLIAFYVCKKNAGIDINSRWCDIPGEDFDNFRLDEWDPEHTYRLDSAPSSTNLSTTTTSLSGKTTSKYTPAKAFDPSIKKDTTLFPVLQDIVH